MKSGFGSSWMRVVAQGFAAVALVALSTSAFAFGSASKFVIIDNESSAFSRTGTWTSVTPPAAAAENPTFFGENFYRATGTGGAADSFAFWSFGVLASLEGSYQFDAFIPDDTAGATANAAVYRLDSAPNSIFSGCGTYTTDVTFPAADQEAREGNWLNIGTATVSPGRCYRLVLTNANNSGAVISANAARAERLFESSFTVTDIPRVATAFAAGTTNVTSVANGAPTIITTLTVTCPAIGQVMVTASGESAAQTNVAGTNFNGLAYSISRNSTATDNNNVVQSSALATFSGDANRDFLTVQRVDTCTNGESVTYRLTAYRSQAATGPASFIWNGRLVGMFFPSIGF